MHCGLAPFNVKVAGVVAFHTTPVRLHAMLVGFLLYMHKSESFAINTLDSSFSFALDGFCNDLALAIVIPCLMTLTVCCIFDEFIHPIASGVPAARSTAMMAIPTISSIKVTPLFFYHDVNPHADVAVLVLLLSMVNTQSVNDPFPVAVNKYELIPYDVV